MFSEKKYGYKTFILKILESKKNWVHKNVGQKYLGCNLDAMVSEY